MKIEFVESAFKHGIRKEQIISALDNPIYEEILETYPDKYLLIGFDENRNLLEIIYNMENYKKVKVFHAMKCRKCYFNLLRF